MIRWVCRMDVGDTIAAVATPLGTGGISIIKISGPEALGAAMALFRPHNPRRRLDERPSQSMVYGHVVDPERGRLVDEVLVSILRGPHSYTGQDVVEINCHGGTVVTQTVLELLLARGVRLAEAGEFTRRAFLNGRIDLTQAEGTLDLIEAKTQRAARMGSRMLHHGVGERVGRLRDRVLEIRARIEAAIDFGEEDDTRLAPRSLRELIRTEMIPVVEKLLEGYAEGRLLRHGMRVALAGKPNVGKSSLMNVLLRRNRAIVTEYPGTTRDTLEEGLVINGLPILLNDTAGLGVTQDPVEEMGQTRAKEVIADADLVLMIIDASRPTDSMEDDILALIADRPYILVRNKVDLVPEVGKRSGRGLPHPNGRLDISARYEHGIEALKHRIIELAGVEGCTESDGCMPNQRQKILLTEALCLLKSAGDPEEGGSALELMAVDLKDCERYFNQILGVDVNADVLDTIFSRFCIGK